MRRGLRRDHVAVAMAFVAVLLVGCAAEPPDGEVSEAPDASEADPAPDVEEAQEPAGPAAETEGDEEPAAVPTPAPPAQPTLTTPVRAVWVHLFDDTLKRRDGIATLVEDLVEADATMVIVQVARRHDAYYRSEVLPPTADPDLEPGLDVLAELVPQARAAGIEVHAWVSVAPTWHAVYEDLPAPAGWVATAHGRDAPEADRWVTRTVDGEWSEYLDPALPAVRDHIAAIAVELATTTEVDGIHLDYVRYESARHGYHPEVLARFGEETGAGAAAMPAPDDPDFVAWRQDQTADLLRHVRATLAAADRDVLLSAPVVTWGTGPSGTPTGRFADTRTARDGLQDWPSWAREGLVDVLFPMNYFREHEPEQVGWFAEWLELEADLAATTDTLIVPGIGGWLNTPAATVAQVERAMRAADGAAVYSYQQPTDTETSTVWRELAERGWGALPGGR